MIALPRFTNKASLKMAEFSKDSFVKIVGTEGNHHYGYIQVVKDRGFTFIISLYDEGLSAMEYETATGTVIPDWEYHLTDVEKSLIPLLAQNLTTKQIATKLSVSPVTIRAQIRTMQLKLQLVNRQQVVTFAQGLEQRK